MLSDCDILTTNFILFLGGGVACSMRHIADFEAETDGGSVFSRVYGNCAVIEELELERDSDHDLDLALFNTFVRSKAQGSVLPPVASFSFSCLFFLLSTTTIITAAASNQRCGPNLLASSSLHAGCPSLLHLPSSLTHTFSLPLLFIAVSGRGWRLRGRTRSQATMELQR